MYARRRLVDRWRGASLRHRDDWSFGMDHPTPCVKRSILLMCLITVPSDEPHFEFLRIQDVQALNVQNEAENGYLASSGIGSVEIVAKEWKVG